MYCLQEDEALSQGEEYENGSTFVPEQGLPSLQDDAALKEMSGSF